MADWSQVAADATQDDAAPGDANSVLHLNIQGLSEWSGTWYRHVRPGLLNYHRNTSWLAHQVVIYGVDHGYYHDYYLYPNHRARMDKEHKLIRVTQVWSYIARFIAASVDLRVPEQATADTGPIQLTAIDRASGWLIHPRAPEELLGTKWFAFRQSQNGAYQTIPWPDEPAPVFDTEQGIIPLDQLVRPATDVPTEAHRDYLWIPNRSLAIHWLNLHGLYELTDRVVPPETASE